MGWPRGIDPDFQNIPDQIVRQALVRACAVGMALVIALGTGGCTTIVFEAAKKAREDRVTDHQFTDTRIGAGILSGLADKHRNLFFDVNADVWETRVLLTGTVADARARRDIVQMVHADKRVLKVHDEIQVVSHEEQARRSDATKKKNGTPKEGIDRVISDVWIETRISAQLISTSDITSVNYRWRSVRSVVYLIGRAQSRGELKAVLEIVRATEGVSQIRSFVEVKPV